MRNTILGFNQVDAIELGLTINDLLILDYIIRANGTPSMNHIHDNNDIPYVWLSHNKLHEDLPILNITEGTLKNKLLELKKLGLIDSKQIIKPGCRGSKTYYSVTEKTIQMTTSFSNDLVEQSRHSESTSDNQLNSIDNKLENTITINSNSNEFLGKIKSTKRKSLYAKCSDQISEFTTNIGLQEVLHDYLKIRLQMKDKPLYEGTWKGMLKKLDKMDNQIDVVNTSIERGWASFFEQKSYSKGKEKFGEDDNIKSVKGEFDSSGETF